MLDSASGSQTPASTTLRTAAALFVASAALSAAPLALAASHE